ncbi:L10-interacting MYB domain-containing protein-like [Abeliophyllum distichum]|uniref:L10-interacting MYB domain-containing protein-like n=1 Tax=Abeliophyllum distichum TaxID=126358 RepID=A0ABD1SX68_9LAMI
MKHRVDLMDNYSRKEDNNIYYTHFTDDDSTGVMRIRKSNLVKVASPTKKNTKWAEREHQIFVTACETVIAEGHRRRMCFSKHGWERLVNLFNGSAAKNWSRTQLKNHWDSIRREHKQLHELLRCTGIEYNQRDNIIVADDDWWEQKIKICFIQNCNGPYLLDSDFCSNSLVMLLGKRQSTPNSETVMCVKYTTGTPIVWTGFHSDKYAMTPTKLLQCGFDGVINSGSESPHDTLPIFAETRESSDEGPIELGSSSRMDISCCHSGEKRKGSARRSKGKAKKIKSVDLSYLVEHLATVGEALAARRQNCQEQVPSYHRCITEPVATRKVPKGSAMYNFALTFLVNRKN